MTGFLRFNRHQTSEIALIDSENLSDPLGVIKPFIFTKKCIRVVPKYSFGLQIHPNQSHTAFCISKQGMFPLGCLRSPLPPVTGWNHLGFFFLTPYGRSLGPCKILWESEHSIWFPQTGYSRVFFIYKKTR